MNSVAVWGLKAAVRRLWADHVIWTRQYIVAAIAGTPDTNQAAGRLLRNQEDIGTAIVPFYGQAAGGKLTDLLKQHILVAVDLIAAAKAGDQAKFGEADKRWYANAEAIATFLSGANPASWPRKDVADLLYLHLNLTKGEVTARLQHNWDADVKAFDDIFAEAMTIADTLSEGIIKQFPDRF